MMAWLKRARHFHKKRPRFRAAKRVMVFGDSNSCCADRKGLSWPAMMEDIASGCLNVINESYEGRTTQYDRGQRNGVKVIKAKLNSHRSLDFVVVMLGTNDLKTEYGPPSAMEITSGIGKIVDIISGYDGDITSVIVTPPPTGVLNSGRLVGAHNRIAEIVSEYKVLANSLKTPMLDLSDVINIKTDLVPDGIHINHLGRKKIAESVWNCMQKLATVAPDIKPSTAGSGGRII
jgi:lysophospholipase L1-like esterase